MSGRKGKDLINALRGLTAQADRIVIATVLRVNSNDTIDVSVNDLEVKEVRLRSVINSQANKVVIYPVVGSYVMITRINRSSQFYVQSVSEVDRIVLAIGNRRMQVTDQGFIYNEGKHTTANADILKDELNKLTKRVDDLISALKNAAPDSASGSFKTSITPMLAAIVQKESWNNIEDNLIKH